jgi:hypothetical protein
MSILTATRSDVKPTTLLIKGLAYSVSKIDPGEEGTAAFRLDKVHGEGVYDVVRTHDGLVRCDCPSYVMTFEGTASTCKHGRALVEAGYLDRPSPIANIPAPVASKAAVRPITRQDQVAARTWGLKLPVDAPMVVEAPAPIVAVVEASAPIVVAELLPAEPQADDDLPESGRSWKGFDDDSQWELSPDAEPIVEVPAPAYTPSTGLADRLWMAETTALLITLDAINGVEWADSAEGRDFDPDAVFDRLEPANRESFATYLRMIGSPVATWHDWLDLCWAGSPVRFPEPTGPRPTRLDRFTPTAAMELEYLGYQLGLAGDDARAPEGRSFSELVAFYGGFLAGRAELEVEYNDWLDSIEADRERMDDAFGSPEDTWHASELAECGYAYGEVS